jgi:peptide/nickel transport system permease protein
MFREAKESRGGKILKKRRIGQRLFQILIVLFGISFLTFGLTYLSPGDPAEIMLTECGNLPTPELLAKTRAELGLDKPFLVQYGSWLKGVLTGNMGTSYSFKVPVIDKLVSCFFPTVKLAFASLVVMLLLSLPLGILSAVYQNRWIDYLVRGITFLGVSIPSFWVGLILLRVFGVNLRWVPVSGGSTDFKSLIMPALTLAFSMSAKYTRQVRTAVLDELRKDYVTGARMRGLSESKILWRHVLPNAMLPLVTLLGLSLGNLLGGTTVVEIIYNWPGMGSMAVKAISCRDYPLVQGYVLWIALLYLGINLLVDISYRRLDPRIKEEIG